MSIEQCGVKAPTTDYRPPFVSTFVVPFTLGLGTFAAIVLTDGTEGLSWVRFLIAAVAFGLVTLPLAGLAFLWEKSRLEARYPHLVHQATDRADEQ